MPKGLITAKLDATDLAQGTWTGPTFLLPPRRCHGGVEPEGQMHVPLGMDLPIPTIIRLQEKPLGREK